jgi:hypothetical protein
MCLGCGVTGLLDFACGSRGVIVMVCVELWWGPQGLDGSYAYGVVDGVRDNRVVGV